MRARYAYIPPNLNVNVKIGKSNQYTVGNAKLLKVDNEIVNNCLI